MPTQVPRFTRTGIAAAAVAALLGPRIAAAAAPRDDQLAQLRIFATNADLNHDGVVDQQDLRLFLLTRNAGKHGALITDINDDGVIDANDLATMLQVIASGSRPMTTEEIAAAEQNRRSPLALMGAMHRVEQR